MILLYYLLGAVTVTIIAVMMVLVNWYAFQKGWGTRDAMLTGNKEYFGKSPDYEEPPEFALLDEQEKKNKPQTEDEEDEE